MKLLAPIIAFSSIAAASGARLRNSKSNNSRDLGVVFDTDGPPSTNSFKELRIIGGDDADEGDFGYTVSLEDDIGHFCGATLVRRDIVISAAHCAGGRMWARVGAHDITNRNEGRRIKVKKEIVSPDYDARSTNFDFMILVLEEAAPDDIPLALLHDGEEILRDNDSLTVIGWGNTNPGNGWNMPDVKQHVEVKYIPTNECNSKNSYNGQITDAMMCAGEDGGGEDACQGDSGGPLVRLGRGGKPDELVGVVSWGYGCASARHPGVYARITKVKKWIDDTIDRESNFSSNSNSGSSTTSSFTASTESTYSEPSSSSFVNPNWREVLFEDFVNDFGKNKMEKGGNHARQYARAYGKNGVARIQHGKGRSSSFSTKKMSARRSVSHQDDRGSKRTSDWRVTMMFQGKGMDEGEDRFCVQIQQDNDRWRDLRCYMSGEDFDNGVWTEETIEFSVDDTTESVQVRWICEGDARNDDVLFDYIRVEREE